MSFTARVQSVPVAGGSACFKASAHRRGASARHRSSQPINATPTDMSKLPGDPSMIMHTNVTLDAETKKAFMKSMSTAITETLSKPESYVAVCVMDGLDLIWGGEDTPCALLSVNSLGAINPENNAALSKIVADAISEFGIPPNRYYITFTDVPRPNMGYNGATF